MEPYYRESFCERFIVMENAEALTVCLKEIEEHFFADMLVPSLKAHAAHLHPGHGRRLAQLEQRAICTPADLVPLAWSAGLEKASSGRHIAVRFLGDVLAVVDADRGHIGAEGDERLLTQAAHRGSCGRGGFAGQG